MCCRYVKRQEDILGIRLSLRCGPYCVPQVLYILQKRVPLRVCINEALNLTLLRHAERRVSQNAGFDEVHLRRRNRDICNNSLLDSRTLYAAGRSSFCPID